MLGNESSFDNFRMMDIHKFTKIERFHKYPCMKLHIVI